MSAQQAQFLQALHGVKRALKRKADDSDSDASIHAPTNRGHKLQRRAKYVQSGHLDSTGGLRAYRKPVTHAGYTRNTIHTAPNFYNEDGELYNSDDEAQGRIPEPAEDDPFAESMSLAILLRPLIAASELPDHPTLSQPFKSKALVQMIDEVAEMQRKERAGLWKAKRLLQRFRGDADWVPCDVFETEHDDLLLFQGYGVESDAAIELESAAPSLAIGQDASEVAPSVDEAAAAPVANGTAPDHMNGIETTDMAVQQAVAEKSGDLKDTKAAENERDGTNTSAPNGEDATTTQDQATTDTKDTNGEPLTSVENTTADAEAASEVTSNSGKETNGTNQPQHAMTTRARARSPIASPSQSPSPSDSASAAQIHPWFQTPASALPDRDLGLPAPEAEESRRLLLLYVQKQENIVRMLDTLYAGLQRADRTRKAVLQACKAEGHMKDDGKGNWVTEMSDGEDWVDPADWGIEARELKVQKDGTLGLEKGKDEVDEIGDEGEGRRGGRRRRVNRM
ncbi:RXT2-like protein [Neohortaea acidophila]|uniref:RXT2-like protein n=1 Tax=Neohortaea acidophila TaxID=245834 RepID=A0A6A6PX50_9PEZI|nr:RXT2-like protein [Neohortaea acidophila]KAF2484331.1 RXT2-like protein [Neohortaea acidophila]